MDPYILTLIIGIAALAAGIVAGKFIFAKDTKKRVDEAEQHAQHLIREAELRSETIRKEKEIAAKEKFVQLKAEHDREIHDWYRAHYEHLPPGLAKRDRLPPGLERQLIVNGTLPPGLQKKMQPCPRELEVMLPPPPPNYVHVVIGGNLVMYNRATLQIGDVFHLDAAF